MQSTNPPSKVSDPASLVKWLEYIDTLNWGPGNRDQSSFSAFLRAGSLGIEPQQAIETVIQRIQSTGGTFSASKISSQQRRTYKLVNNSQSAPVTIIQPPTPAFDPELLKRCAAKVGPIDPEWLKQLSPVSPFNLTSSAFLEHLYMPGEKVLVFTSLHSQGEFLYEVGKDNAALPKLTTEGVWYLVNPVDGLIHPNPRQENKPSRRSEESVTSWRYLVLESDVADPAQWLACLVQLPLQISAIYSSGGKSIHALVRVDADSKQAWDAIRDQLKPIMVLLGADQNAMTGVRLSRLPGAMRALRQQELFYLNPNPTTKPIIELIA